ncbi:MAG TPA: hypothetical protein VGL95_14615 [Acetobacteraceae bacterium]|jgi:hypothetical protein
MTRYALDDEGERSDASLSSSITLPKHALADDAILTVRTRGSNTCHCERSDAISGTRWCDASREIASLRSQ